MTLPVYLDQDLAEGPQAVLAGEEAHHAHVKRTAVGEHIDIVDGRGTRVTVEVIEAGQKSLTGTVLSRTVDPAPAHPITLVQALAKGGRDEAAVESAVEVGVLGIVPWQADRSIVRWAGPKAAKGTAKWQQVAAGAMKQSRQSHLPHVSDVVTTKMLAEKVRETVAAGGRIFICHETATEPLAGKEIGSPGPIWIIVGPEGGVSAAELEMLVEAGGEPVLLGRSVLRSGTAGTAAATVLQVTTGYWR